MICKEYAHCTWDHLRGYAAPADRPGMSREERRFFWPHFLKAEGERAEMRKSEAYKAAHKDGTSPATAPDAAVAAPSVSIDVTARADGIEDV